MCVQRSKTVNEILNKIKIKTITKNNKENIITNINNKSEHC